MYSLVLRILEPLNGNDEELLRRVCRPPWHRLLPAAQGPDTVYRFYPVSGRDSRIFFPELASIQFRPTDFTQVNSCGQPGSGAPGPAPARSAAG